MSVYFSIIERKKLMNKEEIIRIRKLLGLTQERFANLLEATVVTVSRWENGRSKPSRLYVRELVRVREEYQKSGKGTEVFR